jgi:chromosome segregation ATPase
LSQTARLAAVVLFVAQTDQMLTEIKDLQTRAKQLEDQRKQLRKQLDEQRKEQQKQLDILATVSAGETTSAAADAAATAAVLAAAGEEGAAAAGRSVQQEAGTAAAAAAAEAYEKAAGAAAELQAQLEAVEQELKMVKGRLKALKLKKELTLFAYDNK